MNYVGIDWAYGRAAWCAMGEGGQIAGEGMIPADESGLARLVLELGTEAEACVEMMSGAVWVSDQLRAAGWQVKVAHARKVRDVAPLACKTDKVDARVLAELCRRDLVPELWVPSLEDRALRERLRRRMHLVKTRTAARNRIFGLLTQFGLRISHPRLRKPDAMELLERRGVPEVWRASIAELLELIEEIDRRADPDRARAAARYLREDERARLLATIPGIGPLLEPHHRRRDRRDLAVSLAGQARRLCRAWRQGSASPVSAPRPARSRRPARGPCAGRRSRPPTRPGGRPIPGIGHYLRVSARHGKNPAKSSVARKLLIAAWHMLGRHEPFNPSRPRGGDHPTAPANSSCFLTA